MFPSQEAALQFFKGQAEEGLIFFATRVQNGEELDEHVFSCGDKTLYHGSFAEIHAQLQAALALDPTHKKVIKGVKMWDALMPASSLLATELRNKVRDHRQDLEAKSPAAPSPVAHAKPAPSTRGK